MIATEPFQFLRTELVKVTPTIAQKYLEYNTFAGQRTLNTAHVTHLAGQMQKGLFSKGQMAVVDVAGVKMLVNGQHQLHAVIRSGTTAMLQLDHYVAEDMAGASMLFATMDANRMRTTQQAFGAARYGMDDDRLASIPLAYLAVCSTALATLENDPPVWGSTGRVANTDRVALIDTHRDEAMWVYELHKIAARKNPAYVGVITAMIYTRRANAELADEFWIPVLSSTELVHESPQWQLNRYITSGLREYGSSGNRNIMVTSLVWWNRWMRGESGRSVKAASMKTIPKPDTKKRTLL